MCGPLAAAGAAASAAGVLMNMAGANAQQGARTAANAQEQRRQQQYQQDSSNLFNTTLSKADAPTQIAAQGEAADVRASKDAATLDANRGVYGTGGAALDGESKSSIARALSSALTRGKQQAKANAAVNGVGDQTAKMGIELGRAGQWQNIFGGNMRQSAALLPGELENANGSGSTERGIGQVLGAAGQALGTAGMAGGGPSWGSMFGGGAPGGTSPAASIAPRGTTSAGWFS